MILRAVNLYIAANLLLLLAAAGVASLRWINGRSSNPISQGRQLMIAYALSLAVVLLPFVNELLPRAEFLPRNAQVWSAASMGDWSQSAPAGERFAISVASSQVSAPVNTVRTFSVMLFLVGAGVCVAMLVIEAFGIRRIIRGAQTIVRRRRVRVLSSQAVDVPFSFWLPGLHFIVLPDALIVRPADWRMALRHEAQHHRQLDTRLAYAFQLLRVLFFWNPAVHWLHGSVAELQEFACDEALVTRRKISAHAYCSCLLRVAESAMQRHRMAIVAGMLGDAAGRGVLKERVEALLAPPSTRSGLAPAAIGISAAVFALMLGTTAAFSATIQDRRISPQQAQQLLEAARQRIGVPLIGSPQILLGTVQPGGDIPLAVNERVIEQLNRLLGTPDGRAFMREGLHRMRQHEALIAGALAHHALPAELMAVPLVESGYRNLPPSDNPRHGAGLWMFIEPTAREFGLTVNATVDERLDVSLETDAALRMFGHLHEQFGDWGLALLAYNAGERRVEEAVRATGSRDVWRIIEQGYENDPDYVPRVMATLLIMKNPTVLE